MPVSQAVLRASEGRPPVAAVTAMAIYRHGVARSLAAGLHLLLQLVDERAATAGRPLRYLVRNLHAHCGKNTTGITRTSTVLCCANNVIVR